jgi:GT2 family glycosyltransferase
MIPGATKKTVSALLVNHNGGSDVLTCLQALCNQSIPLEKIVVVDNASSDRSPEEISLNFPKVQIINLENNLGLSKAHNIGLREITSDLVLIVDEDVYVDTECISRLCEAYHRYSAAVVCPRILHFHEAQTVQCDGASPHFVGTLSLRHADQPIEALPTDAVQVAGCIGACRLVDRKCVLECGGFDDEYFLYFEDLEFSLRIRALGFNIVCEPKALAYHDRGKGTPRLSFRGQGRYPEHRFYLNVRQRLMTIMIHYRPCTMIFLFPPLFIYEIMSFCVAVQRGWIKNYFSAIASLAAARAHIKIKRRFLQHKRKRNDKNLILGGELPLVDGFLRTNLEKKIVSILSRIFGLYWRFAHKLIA